MTPSMAIALANWDWSGVVTPNYILSRVSSALRVPYEEMTSKGQRWPAVRARWVAMAVLHEQCGMSKRGIAKLMRRDRSTVIHGLKEVAERPALRDLAARVMGG